MLIPKLALVDTVQTPVARYGMCEQKEGFFSSQKGKLTWNIFANYELDLEFLVREEQKEKGILT